MNSGNNGLFVFSVMTDQFALIRLEQVARSITTKITNILGNWCGGFVERREMLCNRSNTCPNKKPPTSLQNVSGVGRGESRSAL